MRFEKWQALGNDYVIVEREELPWELTPSGSAAICEPHFGVGSDGILLLAPAGDPAHVAELRIFNPDGSEAELSGNGAREAVLYLRSHGWTDEDTFSIIDQGGRGDADDHRPRHGRDRRSGARRLTSADYPAGPRDGTGTLESGGREWGFQHVHVGNPQCAIEVADGLEELDLGAIGPGDRVEHRALPEPHQRLVLDAPTARRCARGSSSAGWGRRSRPAPAPAEPPSPRSCVAPRARSRSSSTAAS